MLAFPWGQYILCWFPFCCPLSASFAEPIYGEFSVISASLNMLVQLGFVYIFVFVSIIILINVERGSQRTDQASIELTTTNPAYH